MQVEVRMRRNGIVSRPLGAKRRGGIMALIARKSGQLSARLRDKDGWRTLMANDKFKTIAFHSGVVAFCLLYIAFGAMVFYKIERPLELEYARSLDKRLDQQNTNLLLKIRELKEQISSREEFEEAFLKELNEHERLLFKEFDHPVSANYFDSLVYNNATYMDMWTIASAFLFATTTVIPVGFGLITPRSFTGRLLLVLYAICGIPLALVTISDVGRFICDFVFRLFKRNTKTAVWLLTSLAVLYPLFASLLVWRYSSLSLIDSYYYCLTTSLTIGFGDIPPPVQIPVLIGFITCGVILMTISIEVVGTNAIHQIHYMGRQVGKARQLAGRFLQMAHLNINTQLGAGMTQLSNLAKFGLLLIPGAGTHHEGVDEDVEIEWLNRDGRSAFEPRIPGLKFVDVLEFEEF